MEDNATQVLSVCRAFDDLQQQPWQAGVSTMTHKYRGSIVVISISKSVEPNEEKKKMTSGFQQGIFCRH